jgi:hypothetical protein
MGASANPLASKATMQASTPGAKLAQFVSTVDFGSAHSVFHHDFRSEHRLLDDVDNLKVVGKRGGTSAKGLGTGPPDLDGIDPNDGTYSGGGWGTLSPIYGTRVAS